MPGCSAFGCSNRPEKAFIMKYFPTNPQRLKKWIVNMKRRNAQVSNMRDSSLLRRISLARDIHEQLSDAIVLFSDISRSAIIGLLLPLILHSLMNAMAVFIHRHQSVFRGMKANDPVYIYIVVHTINNIVILTGVCQPHKNNRRMISARLRHLIAFCRGS